MLRVKFKNIEREREREREREIKKDKRFSVIV